MKDPMPQGTKMPAAFKDLVRHHVAAALALPATEQEAALNDSVEEHGVIHPIILCDGKVLDGWLRFRAAQKYGKDCPTMEYTGDKSDSGLTTYLIAINVHRRHYTALQRALLAGRLLVERRGWVKGGPQEFSAGRASAMFSVSQPYIQLALRVIASKNTLLIQKVEAGKATREEIEETLSTSSAPRSSAASPPIPAPSRPEVRREPSAVITLPTSQVVVKEFKQLKHDQQIEVIAAFGIERMRKLVEEAEKRAEKKRAA